MSKKLKNLLLNERHIKALTQLRARAQLGIPCRVTDSLIIRALIQWSLKQNITELTKIMELEIKQSLKDE